jgi:hypothetical protein
MKFTWKGFEWRATIISIAIWIFCTPVIYQMIGVDFFSSAFFSGVLVVGINFMHRKYVATLLKRISSVDELLWDVKFNGVQIGKIKDSDYAAICLDILHDVHIYIRQAANIGGIMGRWCIKILFTIPVVFFWIIIGIVVFSPDRFTILIPEVRKTIAHGMGWPLFNFFMELLFFVTAWVIIFFGRERTGFVNYFSESNKLAVQKQCGIAAAAKEGKVMLVRYDNGNEHYNDELADFWGSRAGNIKEGGK